MTLFERASHSPAPTTPTMTVAASPDQLEVVRAFVRTVTAHHALSADALTDLVLAVDEAVGILLNHALPSSILTCTFDIDTEHLRVILAATTTAPIDTSTTSFRWFVLQTLVDRIVLEQFPSAVAGAPGNSAVTIILDKSTAGRFVMPSTTSSPQLHPNLAHVGQGPIHPPRRGPRSGHPPPLRNNHPATNGHTAARYCPAALASTL